MPNNEQAVVEAIRAHEGGLGGSLSEKRKKEIIYGRKNEPESTKPIDGEKLNKAFLQALKDHPVEWFME